MKRLLGFGLLLWGSVFAIGTALYPLRVGEPRFFASVLFIVLGMTTTAVGVAFTRGTQAHVLRDALSAGCVWPLMCVVLDWLALSLLPPRFGIVEYLRDFGAAYLIIPAILLGLGYQHSQDTTPHTGT